MPSNPKSSLKSIATLCSSIAARCRSAAQLKAEWPDSEEIQARQLISALQAFEPIVSGFKKARKHGDWWLAAKKKSEAGQSVNSIAKDLKVSRQAVQYALRQQGVDAKAHRCELASKLDAPMIVMAYRAGLTLRELAVVYGVSDKAIRRVLATQGCKVRGQTRVRVDLETINSAWAMADDRPDSRPPGLMEAIEWLRAKATKP